MADDAAHRARRHRPGILQPGRRGHADVLGARGAGGARLRGVPDGDAVGGGRRRGPGRGAGRRDRARLGARRRRGGLRGGGGTAFLPRRRAHPAARAGRRPAGRSAGGLAGVQRAAVAVGDRRAVLDRQRGGRRGRRGLRSARGRGASRRGGALGARPRRVRRGHGRRGARDDPLPAAPAAARRHPVRLPARPALRRPGGAGTGRRAVRGDVPHRAVRGGLRCLVDDRAAPGDTGGQALAGLGLRLVRLDRDAPPRHGARRPAESALGRPNALWGCAAVIVLVTAAVLCVPEVRTLRRRTPKAPLPRPRRRRVRRRAR